MRSAPAVASARREEKKSSFSAALKVLFCSCGAPGRGLPHTSKRRQCAGFLFSCWRHGFLLTAGQYATHVFSSSSSIFIQYTVSSTRLVGEVGGQQPLQSEAMDAAAAAALVPSSCAIRRGLLEMAQKGEKNLGLF